MTPVRMLVVPADDQTRVSVVNVEEDQITSLVFAEHPEWSELTFSAFNAQKIQCAYDDLGLFRQGDRMNARAMFLWAALRNMSVNDFQVPLVGNFVFFGYDDEGESIDIPDELVTMAQFIDIALADVPEGDDD